MIKQGNVSTRLAGWLKYLVLTVAIVGLSVLPRAIAEIAESGTSETMQETKPDSAKQEAPTARKTTRLIGEEPFEFEKTPQGYSDALDDTPEATLAIAHSSNGQFVVTTHEDGSVRLRAAESGKLLRRLEGHQDSVSTVAFSPDSRLLATGSYDHLVKLWNVATGESIRDLEGHSNWVFSVRFSPNGKTLASAGYDKTIRLWDVEKGESRGILEGHSAAVRSVAFSPDGQQLVSGSSDRTVRVWDLKTRNSVHELKGHSAGVRAVDYAPDGSRIASGSEDKTIRFWNPNTGESLQELKGHQGMVWTLAFSPRGRTLASGGFDNKLIIWNGNTGTALQTLDAHQDVLTALSYAPDSYSLITGSYDKTLKLWPGIEPPVSALADLNLSEGSSSPAIRFVIFTPDGKRIITGNQNRKIRLWDLETGQVVKQVVQERGVSFGALDAEGKLLATSGYGGASYLFDVETLKLLKTFDKKTGETTTVALSPNGQVLVSGTRDGSLTVWDTDSGEIIQELPRLELPIEGLAFAPDGKLLASTSGDYKQHTKPGTVKLWNTETWEEVANLPGPTQKMRAIRFSPDGNTLIAGGSQAELLVYDVAARELSKRISFGTEVSTCAFLPESRFALLGGYDGRVELWDLSGGVRTVRYEGHRPASGNHNFLFDMAASVDGSVLASGSGDGHVKLWPATHLKLWQLPARQSDQPPQLAERIRKWQPRKPVGAPIALEKVKTFEPHGEKVWFAIYSPDGKTLATGGTDHTVKLWNVETMEVLQTLSGHGSFTTHAAFSPDGKQVATVSWTSKENLKLWDVQTGELLASSDLHKNACRQVAFSPDGQWIATACEDHFVRLFNADLEMVSSIDAGLNAYSVAFSPDSHILAVGTGNLGAKEPGRIVLYDPQTGQLVKEMEKSGGYVFHLQFLKEGKRLLAANGGAGCAIWNIETGEMEELYRSANDTRWVEIDREEQRIVATARVGEIFLYDRSSATAVASVKVSEKFIHCATFSPDGEHIVVADEAGELTLWEMKSDKQSQVAKSNDPGDE